MTTKTSTSLKGLRHMARSVGRGGIPSNPKSAFAQLHMLQNEKSRLLDERERMKVRSAETRKRLSIINKEMTKLLKMATKGMKVKVENPGHLSKEGKKLILNY